MLERRTLKILAGLLSAYAVLSVPAWWGPAFLEGISSYIYIAPILAVYLFHYVGIPGLLEHKGACGWGLCAPTILGWAFLILFWLGATWLVAWGIARLTARSKADGR